MNQVVSNNLKKNYSTWGIFSIINNTKLNDKPVVGWKIIGGQKVTVDLFIRVIRKFRNELVVRATNLEGRNMLANLITGSDKLNLYLPDDLVLFQSEIKNCDATGDLVITLPKMIAQVDRRKHLRLFVNDEMNVILSFAKQNHGQRVSTQQFEKKCFDISAGGISFIISKIEAKFFEVGDLVFGISLYLDKRKTLINAEVVNILDVEPDDNNGLHYKGKKVCIRYLDPTANQQKVINDFVFKYIQLDDAI
jgi:hypothetical protein